MAISLLPPISAQLAPAATFLGAADREPLQQVAPLNETPKLQRDESVGVDTIDRNAQSLGPHGGSHVETANTGIDLNPLERQEPAADPPLVSVALAAASAAPQRIADSADAARAAVDRVTRVFPPDARSGEIPQREAAAAGREVDERIFENAHIIPVGFYVTGRPDTPFMARIDAEPAVAARAYHGVLSGRTSARPNPGQNAARPQTQQPSNQPVVVAPSAPLANTASSSVALLRTRSVFRQVRNPRAAFQQPSTDSGTFDERA